MEWPLVSVIIVNFNGAYYLPACLDCVRLIKPTRQIVLK